MFRFVTKIVQVLQNPKQPDQEPVVQEIVALSNLEFQLSKLLSEGTRQAAKFQVDQTFEKMAGIHLKDMEYNSTLSVLIQELKALSETKSVQYEVNKISANGITDIHIRIFSV